MFSPHFSSKMYRNIGERKDLAMKLNNSQNKVAKLLKILFLLRVKVRLVGLPCHALISQSCRLSMALARGAGRVAWGSGAGDKHPHVAGWGATYPGEYDNFHLCRASTPYSVFKSIRLYNYALIRIIRKC